MHDTTRIADCRWGFVLLCVVPTLLTCGFIAYHRLTLRSPAAKAEWERELSQRLGMAVSIENLSYPQPNTAELSVLKLSDAETGQTLGECRRVEVAPRDKQWEVTLVEPTIRRDALAFFAARLHERMLTSGAPLAPLRLTAAHLAIDDETNADSLVDLVLTIAASHDGPSVMLRSSLPQDVENIELRIARNRQVSPPETQVEWHCPAPLPAHLLGGLLGDSHMLGTSATITGSGRVTFGRSGASGQWSGEVAHIDLTTMVSQRFPHLLSGQATLTVEHAALDRGRLAEARGTLVVDGGGRISRSLLDAAGEHLQLVATLPTGDEESLRYQRLALNFELTADHLQLKGTDQQRSDTLVAGETGTLLSAPSGHEVASVALVRTLLPDNRVQVPAALQTAGLVQWLPSPSAEPTLTSQRPAHTPTRLRPSPGAAGGTEPIREGSLR